MPLGAGECVLLASAGAVSCCDRGAGGEVGVVGGEGGEVVGAEDVGGGLLEMGEVEREAAGPDVGSEHGGADLRIACGEDAVLVGLAAGAVAGVEVLRGRARRRGCGCWGEGRG